MFIKELKVVINSQGRQLVRKRHFTKLLSSTTAWSSPRIRQQLVPLLQINYERRQHGQVARAPDLKSGYPESKSRSDHLLDLFELLSSWFNSSTALVHSELVCLLQVGILNLLPSLRTSLPTYLPTYLQYLPPYLPMHGHLPPYLPTSLPTSLLTYLPTSLPSCLSIYLPIYLPAYLPTNLPSSYILYLWISINYFDK